MISDDVDHDGTFWGIGFPVGPPSPDISTIGIVQDDLEGRGDAMLDPGLKGFDLAVIADAVVCKLDRKFIEHKKRFSKPIKAQIKLLCQAMSGITGSEERPSP
jgi:hypothetical protein